MSEQSKQQWQQINLVSSYICNILLKSCANELDRKETITQGTQVNTEFGI